jgi:eukaryotic-like serine/threonine-protein kinase
VALTPGTIVGPYEILGLLGAGGMGEVYRARDTRLNREVALKTLPSTVSGDPDRLARFKREAQLLASLNHPNIGCIHGFEESSGMPALILELVDGPTLEDRLARGPIPPNEVWPIARQLCDALEAAHERSIIHRDLKPANIKLRPDGTVKVLDFGLAKALDPMPSGSTPDVTMSPTITSPAMTRAGVILGTAAYMSPEQARGATLDARTDVWAFGCVLYEMLSGRRAFPGNTVSDAIAAILEREPVWAALPAATPEPIRRLLRRCLVKDSKQRLRHIADARIEIEEAAAARTDSTAAERQPKPQGTSSRWPIAIAVAAAAVLAAGIVWNIRRPPVTRAESKSVARLLIEPSEQLSMTVENLVAISRDGQRLVYVGGPERRLYMRNLDQYESQPIQGTEGADCPVFSPDGRWLAFIADRQLKKISTEGGTPLVLSDLRTAGSLSWSAGGDTIFFSPGPASGISSVSANSGKPVEVTKLAVNELSHRFPDVLPDGNGLLFSDLAGPDDEPIYAQSLKTGQRHVLGNGVAARYLPTGHVVYVTGSTLYAVPFDLNRLETTGTPIPLVTNILRPSYSTAPQVSISQTGTLAYLSDNGQREQDALVWVDQRGIESAVGPVGGPYAAPRISPNGRKLAVKVGDTLRSTGDVQIYDFAREYWNRLTGVGEVGATMLLWTPDSKRLTLGGPFKDGWHIYSKSLDGTTADEQLLSSPGTTVPLAWSPNGNELAIVTVTSATGQDVAILDHRHPGPSRAFVNSKAREGAPAFSPDGHWIAYVSDKSGSAEVYLRPYPGPGEEVPVSADGGIEPVWATKAPVIFYRRDDVMMAVDVVTTPTLSVGKPRRLFERPYAHSNAFWANYDVTANGERLLMVKAVAPVAPTKINVVLNWFTELQQRVPTR